MLARIVRQPLADQVFAALLLCAGAEVLSINVAAVNVKYIQVAALFAITAVWGAGYRLGGFDRRYAVWAATLVAIAGLSALRSTAPVRTVAYAVYLVFSLLLVGAFVFAYVGDTDRGKVLRLYLTTNRVQVLLLLGEAVIRRALGSPDRPSLWYYEPSYMSVSVVGYFTAALYLLASRADHGLPRSRLDVTLAILALLPMASFLGIAACLATTVVVLVVTRRYRFLLVATGVTLAIGAVMGAAFADSELYRLNVSRFVEQSEQGRDLLYMFASRSGTRIARLFIGWHAIEDHWLTGVGLGADADYSWTVARSVVPSEYTWEGTEPLGAPFVNPFVEMFGTTGILGLGWLVGTLVLIVRAQRRSRALPDRERCAVTALFAACAGSFLGLQMEGTLFRFYFLLDVIVLLAMYRVSEPGHREPGSAATR